MSFKINSKFFFTGQEITKIELHQLLDLAMQLKKNPIENILKNKNIALLFEKPSLRTRVSFTVGIQQLGGQVIELTSDKRKYEDPEDTIRVLQGYVQGLMIRTFEHDILHKMAKHSRIPIINGLSDLHHPCQVLADLQTLKENFGELNGKTIAYVGDGNNMLHSILLMAPMMGIKVHYACPTGFKPNTSIVKSYTNGSIREFSTAAEAVTGVDAIYTDVWTSMGFENSGSAIERQIAEQNKIATFSSFQLNAKLLSYAKPEALIMHCMPTLIDQEITREIVEHKNSVLFQQSENRLHAQKALMIGMFA